MKIGEYECLSCSYVFKAQAGPVSCPQCHHIYLLWLNYEKLFEK